MALTPLTQLPQREAAAKRLPLPENSPFQIYIDPLRVCIIDGEYHYNPVEIPFAPGRQNVTSSDTGPMKLYQEDKLKRILVPMDTEVTAWGETVTGYMVCKDIGKDRMGKDLKHYHSVFTRYVQIGNSLIPEFDYDGWADFCKRCTAIVGQPPHQQVRQMEARRLARAAKSHRRIANRSPGAVEAAEKIEAKIASTKKGAGKAKK